MSAEFTIELDPRQLRELEERLDPEAYADALDILETDVQHAGEGHAKEHTPVVTGHARRHSVSDMWGRFKALVAKYPYFRWLDRGEDRRGRKMQTRPGGYQIRAQTLEDTRRDVPDLVDRAGREIAERWAA